MPDIAQQIQQQIVHAHHHDTPVKIMGGGTKEFMGRDVSGEALDVAGHSGIVDYQPVELVLTVRGGTTLDEIKTVLDEKNQMLAFEPPRFSDKSTIAGTLACNLSGPSRPWAGSVRDHLLGIRLINGIGEHLKFGGQVMKNVAGYDVSRLQAGALGTLGVLTEMSFKVLPKPAYEATISWEMSAAEAVEKMNLLAGQPKPMSAACWFDGVLRVRLSGAKTAVLATLSDWNGQVDTEAEFFWQSLRDRTLEHFQTSRPLWRLSVNSSAKVASNEGLVLIDWGGAQRWYQSSQNMDEMSNLADCLGGQATLYSGGDRHQEVFHPTVPALQAIQKRLKHSFDPKGILNRGRLYSWM